MNVASSQTSTLLPPTGYPFDPNSYDDWFDGQGMLRPEIHSAAESLSAIPPDDLNRAWERSRRYLYENGITYNLQQEGREGSRSWSLDPIPVLIAEKDWKSLEKGLLQRAYILNAVLADLYGAQRLIRERIISPELAFANPAFLRPCVGMSTPRNLWLHRYGVDLSRQPDGSWLAVSDRTQSPVGSGYALENRIVLSRLFPQVMRQHHVSRLAPFFKQYHDTLVQLLPPSRQEDPHIVMLSPGPDQEAYFEHSYLAKYMGFTLVEGADLTVRDDIVYLKTLEGLVAVDAIVRRIDDWSSDPLWLESGEAIGVPGVLSAARAGNVIVVNALGSGVLESPALLPFMPELARYFLAEELLLPSVQTWWCGREADRRYVFDHFNDLMIKAAYPRTGFQTVFAKDLSDGDQTALKARIEATPYAFVAQERIQLPTAPLWNGSSLQPHRFMLRSHIIARANGTYAAMPGGLTRVAPVQGSFSITQESGGACKDTWILSTQPVEPVSLLPSSAERLELRRAARNLPSRMADNLFWMSRYLERAETELRSVRMLLTRLSDATAVFEISELRALFDVISSLFETPAPVDYEVEGSLNAVVIQDYLRTLIDREDSDQTLKKTFERLRQSTWKVRDRISTDAWRILNQLENEPLELADDQLISLSDWFDRINHMLTCLTAFSGLEMESMTRATGWRFLEMGRRLERALNTLGLISVVMVDPDDEDMFVMKLILELLDSSMTYRSRYFDDLQVGAMLDLVLLDETNPRSVAFQVAALVDHVRSLPRSQNNAVRSREERSALSALTELRLADAYVISDIDAVGRRGALSALCADVANELTDFSDALSLSYFSHSEELQMLSKGDA